MDCCGAHSHSAARFSTRFTVREQQDGTANLTFSYRVVARRRDIAGARMERIEVHTKQAPTPAIAPSRVQVTTPTPLYQRR